MLILLCIVFVIITCVFLYMGYNDNWYSVHNIYLTMIGTLGLVVMLFLIMFSTYSIASGRVIDSKIAMYQEENKNIETQIDELIKQYMKYESDTYKDFKGESIITLISLYPELKTDKLAVKQCEVYIKNNNKITKLKEEKINLSTEKWMLYFGK